MSDRVTWHDIETWYWHKGFVWALEHFGAIQREWPSAHELWREILRAERVTNKFIGWKNHG